MDILIKLEKDRFINITKKVNKQNLSTNLATLQGYREEIITGFNEFSTVCAEQYKTADANEKQALIDAYSYITANLKKTFGRLGVEFELLEVPFSLLDPSLVSAVREPSSEDIAAAMAEKKIAFAKLCNSQLGHSYNGDEAELNAFIRNVEILKSLAEADQATLLVQIVKSKLTGIADQCVAESDTTVEAIITSLRSRIRPDTAEVIQGRLTALRIDKQSVEEFSQKVEALSGSFKRALIIEGLTEPIAHKMTIKKTIEVCREASRSDVVDAVLSPLRSKHQKKW